MLRFFFVSVSEAWKLQETAANEFEIMWVLAQAGFFGGGWGGGGGCELFDMAKITESPRAPDIFAHPILY